MLHDITVCPTNDWDTNKSADMFQTDRHLRDTWTEVPSKGRVGQIRGLVVKVRDD
jgi:hypothetical protein